MPDRDKKTKPIGIFELTTTRPVAILMIVIALVVFGWVSYLRLPLNLMPDISYPTLTVRTEYPGSSPHEVETTVSRKIEQILGVLDGLNTISSVSRPGVSDVILEFEWGTDMNKSVQDIRENLDQLNLPDEVETPLILRYDPSLDPIMKVELFGGSDLFALRRLADEEVQRELEAISGVAAVRINGGLEREISVELSATKINNLGLDIQNITGILGRENVNIAGGNLKEGSKEYIVRTLGEFSSLNEIRNTVVNRRGESNIRLKDIGTVEKTHKERESITRTSKGESVRLSIYKEAEANIVDVSDRLKRKIRSGERSSEDSLSGSLPEGVNIRITSDQSTFIVQAINEVKNSALIGGVLAIIILYIFLRNFSHTAIIGVAIPVSVVCTFAPMNLWNVSLNIMSLGGLALGIGMLVDNSIVVLESIFRCREEGDGYVESVIRGTREVGGAVTASTLTTISVFFPIVFVRGIAGQVFGDMGLTVVFSLIASLGVALFLIPMLSSRKAPEVLNEESPYPIAENILKKPVRKLDSVEYLIEKWKTSEIIERILSVISFPLYFLSEITGRVLTVLFYLILGLAGIPLYFAVKYTYKFVVKKYIFPAASTVLEAITEVYKTTLEYSLNHRGRIVGVAFVLLAGSFLLIPKLGTELIPRVHQGKFNVEVTLPPGTPLKTTDKTLKELSKIIKKQEDVAFVSSIAGSEEETASEGYRGENSGIITVIMEGRNNLKFRENNLIERLRDKISDYPRTEIKFTTPALFSFETPVEIQIKGYSLTKLRKTAGRALKELRSIPGLSDLKSSAESGVPEIQIVYDRERLSRLGLNIRNVASLVKNKIQGEVPTEFTEYDKRTDIRVRLKKSDRNTIEQLKGLVVNPGDDQPVKLDSVAEINIAEGPSEIRRVDQQRTALITGNVNEFDLGTVSERIREKMEALDLPGEFTYNISGQSQEMKVSLRSLRNALFLAIFLVYVVMASQFESIIHPLIILLSIPMALIGVIIVLYITDIPLSIVVFLGVIMLAGIVVNNAIVLIDYTNQLSRGGKERDEAVKLAGEIRLRPILMTTATTVIGLFPLAIGLGEGSEIRTPMAIAVIAGLISSTFLTLIVIPLFYSLMESWKESLYEIVTGNKD